MSINANGLGWRESSRLCQFIEKMLEEHPSDLEDVTFTYDMRQDEPMFYNNDYQTFFASDYDYAFTWDNEIVSI